MGTVRDPQGNVTEVYGGDTGSRESGIPRATVVLSAAIDTLGTTVAKMQKVLTPLLCPSETKKALLSEKAPAADDGAPVERAPSPTRHNIYGCVNRIKEITEQVKQLTGEADL